MTVEKHYVYAICCPDSGRFVYVKLGRSKDVPARVASLMCGCPLHPKLIYTLEVGDFKASVLCEGLLHKRFDRFRVNREWFQFDAQGLRDMNADCRRIAAEWPGSPEWRVLEPQFLRLDPAKHTDIDRDQFKRFERQNPTWFAQMIARHAGR